MQVQTTRSQPHAQTKHNKNTKKLPPRAHRRDTNKPRVRAATHSATGCDTKWRILGASLTYCVLSMRGLRIMSSVLSWRACACARRECVRARFALWSRDSRDGRAYRRASDPLSPTKMLLLLACLCVVQYHTRQSNYRCKPYSLQ